MRRRTFLTGAAAGLGLAGCGRAPALTGPDGVTLTFKGSYSPLKSRALLTLAGVKGITVRHAVDCWSVVYPGRDGQGRPVRLSGLLALPRGVAARGLVSWQHGTTTTRSDVPSNLSTEGLAAAIVFGANGYAAVAADYLGLGVSPLVHTYYAADDTAAAVIGLLDVVKEIPGVPGAPPFLIGFSQGGHASLATQRALEAAGRPVLGCAPVAAAPNLRTISLPAAMTGQAVQASLYLSYLARGLAARYAQPLDSALTPEMAALARRLYDQPHKPDEIIAALPKDPRRLFVPEFLAALDGQGTHWLVDAAAANEVSHFKPKASVRLYYGSADIDVTPKESVTTARMFASAGADARAIDLGPVDHNASALKAGPLALAWLEALAEPAKG